MTQWDESTGHRKTGVGFLVKEQALNACMIFAPF